MKITLINLPSPALGEPWTNFPLGLGYVAAAIERRGYDVSILDMSSIYQVEGADIAGSNIFGLSVTTPQFEFAKDVARLIKKEHLNSLVVAGGPHALVAKEDFLKDPNFDSVVVEEGEFSFYELIRHYELYGGVEQTYWNPPIRLMDDVPFPARHLLPDFKRKAQATHALLKDDYTEGGQTTIIASRGCPYKCSFCAPHPRKVRYRSPKNVIDELRQIIDQFGIYQFKWQDDTFTLNRRWIMELCDLIRKKLPKTYHRAHTRVNVFDDEMACAMKQAGFKVLCFGIESFSQSVLDRNMKGITIDQIESAFKIAKSHGFKTVGFLIFGMPGESKETVSETQRGVLRNKRYLDYLNLATMVPLPGTPIWNDPDKFGCEIVSRDYSKLWIVDHEKDPTVLVTTKGVSVNEMSLLKKSMYQFIRDEGYARPEWRN
jgi:radical SAM superfamily enzyme YgiQ (UPF0313 family)